MKTDIFLKKIKAFFLAFLIIISAFSLFSCGSEETADDGAGYSFNYTLLGNPKNLDPQLATDSSSLMIIKNMFLGLMTLDETGKVIYGTANNCIISPDGLEYKFTLREDCFWYTDEGEQGVVTAHDFVYAFKRIYNPVMCSPYREKFSFIQNAQDIIDGNLDYSALGVYAVSNTELVFYLDRPCSEFLYLLTTSPAMPCNKNFFEGTKARYGLDDESVISNGAFYITQWSYDPYGSDNLIYMKRNFKNTEYDRVYPYMITFVIEREEDAVLENFNQSESDCIISETEHKKTFLDSYTADICQYASAGIIFNSDYNIDRKLKNSLSVCINREELTNNVKTSFLPAYAIIPFSLNVGEIIYRSYMPETAFSIYSGDYYVSQEEREAFYSEVSENPKILVKNRADDGMVSRIVSEWHDKLGINIVIDYAESDEYYSRLENKEYCMAFVEITSVDSSVYYFMKNIIEMAGTDDDLEIIEKSLEVTADDEKSQIFAETENRIITVGEYIPLFYRQKYLVHRKNQADLWFNPFSDCIDFRYAKNFE